MNRLHLLGFAVWLALIVGCAHKPTASTEPLKIGFVYSGPVGDVGWTHQHELGRRSVEKEFGSRVKTVVARKRARIGGCGAGDSSAGDRWL